MFLRNCQAKIPNLVYLLLKTEKELNVFFRLTEFKSQRFSMKELLNDFLSKKYFEYKRLAKNAQIIIFHQ